MTKVRMICTLPNASSNISGVRFAEDRGQMLSDPIDEALADALFGETPGFARVRVPSPAPAAPEPETDDAEAEERHRAPTHRRRKE